MDCSLYGEQGGEEVDNREQTATVDRYGLSVDVSREYVRGREGR